MYEGEYKNNRQSGKGIRTRSVGSKYDRLWKNGKLWKETIYVKNGTILSKYEDGLPVKKVKETTQFLLNINRSSQFQG